MAIQSSKRIARRNVRITFQRNEAYSDKYKNRMQRWTDYFTCSAYANTYTAQEEGNEVRHEERSVVFETRWCPELAVVTSTGFRIAFEGQQYNILSIDSMNYQKDTIRFSCKREKRQEAV